MMTKDRANAIMQGAPATEEEKREAEKFLREAGSNGSNYEGGAWYYPGNSTVAEDKIAELEQAKRMENPIEGASGNIARGNQGDNAVANPDELDTSDITEIHKAEKAQAQTPENMEPDTFTPNREEAEAVTGVKAGSKATIEKTDSDADKVSKKKYNKSMMSIWDAYNNGLIDKETAGYFTVDALATLAKNLGRSIGNIGAQFTGGAIDNNEDVSMWEQRKDKIFNTELQKESEEIKTFDNLLKGYQVDKAATVNDMLRDFRAKASDKNLSATERKFYETIAVQLAGAGLDGNTQIASIGSGLWDDIKAGLTDAFGM